MQDYVRGPLKIAARPDTFSPSPLDSEEKGKAELDIHSRFDLRCVGQGTEV